MMLWAICGNAFGDINIALDEISRYRQEALPQMAHSILELDQLTTEAEKERVVAAIQAGVTDYLVKPFTPDSLKEKLEKHCASMV